ncbi:MAG TPA: glycoside hydrolase family 2 TIM barrel-domain containing protein, partial [Longimicrobiales bacterium]|nr:glycoside hydrolase family 2 TIM barrel-domain containing protein [Longimicrobiales bacterium]
LDPGERLLLHFNAVDWAADVWAGGSWLARHEGGYTPFAVDLTPLLAQEPGCVTIVVRAEDDPFDLAKPRGKQDWQLEPHSIWYPRTSGIWQTVWIERIPEVAIASVRWTPNLELWQLGLSVRLAGRLRPGLKLQVSLTARDTVLAEDRYLLTHDEITRRIALSDPGIDDYRNEFLWSPQSPTLVDARLELMDAHDRLVDEVHSYTALRSVDVQGQTVVLNGRPYPLRMVLDQGYWPETGMTPPDDEALRRDVELAKAMGFNGVRKHQKIEDPRWLHWADRVGLLVWEEMPSAYRFTPLAVERIAREWIEIIRRDYSHPCIAVWVTFNESWGVPNLPEIPAQRDFVQALYHLTRTLDPTRLVVGNDGWESGATDLIGIHDYDESPSQLAARYGLYEYVPHLFRRERPGGRMLSLEGQHHGQPILLSEFGGIACAPQGGDFWGYSVARTTEELQERFEALLEVVRNLPALAGFCYTQFADTYQEANGLLFADRTPKFPLERMAAAVRGQRRPRQLERSKEADRGEPGAQHGPAAP